MKLLDSTSIIDNTLKSFNMNFNGYQDNVNIIRKFDINTISIISLRKNDFTDWVFALMFVYQKKAMSFDEFRRTLECLLESLYTLLQETSIAILEKYHQMSY